MLLQPICKPLVALIWPKKESLQNDMRLRSRRRLYLCVLAVRLIDTVGNQRKSQGGTPPERDILAVDLCVCAVRTPLSLSLGLLMVALGTGGEGSVRLARQHAAQLVGRRVIESAFFNLVLAAAEAAANSPPRPCASPLCTRSCWRWVQTSNNAPNGTFDQIKWFWGTLGSDF